MNRPSLYAAFGDKRSLYLLTLERYAQRASETMAVTLDPERPLDESLRRLYEQALDLYLPAGAPPRGCYLIGTAATEAAGDAGIRAVLNNALRGFERALAARFWTGQERGEIDSARDASALASIASAVLHLIAVRSRAGEPRAALKAIAETSVELLCGRTQTRSARGKSRITRGPLAKRAKLARKD